MKQRCRWAECGSLQLKAYHDEEWGKPIRGDRELFELLILESFHTGLSWQIVLHKREAFRSAMDHFDPNLIANYDAAKVDSLMQNPQLIRHRGKIQAAIINARSFLAIQQEYGSFLAFIQTVLPQEVVKLQDIPQATTVWSDELARKLKQKGMRFLGSVTVEAFLEAAGFLDGHEPACFCAAQVQSQR